MDTSFSRNQFESIYPDGIENNFWHTCRNRVIERFSPNNHKILEIGCGRGFVTNYLHCRGFDIAGVELSAPKLITTSAKIWKATDANELPIEFRLGIETILLLDVLEHLENPSNFLEQISKSYPNLRRIVITVPARMELWSNYDTFNGHFKRYSRKSISESITVKGFVIQSNRYFFHSLYFIMWIVQKISGSKRATAFKSPIGIMRLFHQVLGRIFHIESLLIPGFIYGSSILYILERKT